jgi:glycosyltransferase involved in cell wall biosynthesis
LQTTGKVELMVVSFVVGRDDQSVSVGGIRHELIGIDRQRFNREFWFYPTEPTRRKCRDLVAAFKPDLVHVHGTEASYGLLVAEGEIQCPTVVSLQGMLGAINRFEYGGLSVWDRLRTCTLRDVFGNHGLVRGSMIAARRAREVERRILCTKAVFVGQTFYDRACLRAVNPQAVYCHCDQVMRRPFYIQSRDSRQVVRESIFVSAGGGYPRKGFHCLLKAAALLREEFPDITVRVTGARPTDSWLGSGYQRYLCRLMRQAHLEDRVTFLGELDTPAMAGVLARSHVFALPSFADNSPNGLAEAMLVGTPVVTAFVGGVPSMVRHEETALCFPVGDEIVMAECLRTMFSDECLAGRLACNAQIVATNRHDPAKIAERMLEIYALAASSDEGDIHLPKARGAP